MEPGRWLETTSLFPTGTSPQVHRKDTEEINSWNFFSDQDSLLRRSQRKGLGFPNTGPASLNVYEDGDT